jgi:membrane-associated phospholipid phosphatase
VRHPLVSGIVGRMTRTMLLGARAVGIRRVLRAPLLLLCATWLFASGLTAQENAGTVLAVAVPAAAFAATTLIHDDAEGRRQLFMSAATNLAATLALKFVISKERPDGSDNESFPSGHTSVAFQGASFIHLRYGLRYAIPAYAGAAFVGYSREDARKHDWVDVISGAAIGTLSSLLFTDRFSGVRVTPTRVGRGSETGAGYGLQVSVRFQSLWR